MAFENNHKPCSKNNSGFYKRSQGSDPNSEYDPKYEKSAEDFLKNPKLEFKAQWITAEADREMVTFAEEAGHYMAYKKLTTSKFRNFYGEVKRIQMAKFKEETAAFFLLKPKLAYALGREKDQNVAEGLRLLQEIFKKCYNLVEDDKTYKNFCNLMEAILAYHKSFGGKDQ